MPSNNHYLSRVVPQHRKPKFLKWLETNIQPFYEAETLLKALDGHFDLSQSVGVQMETTGDIVGRERTLSFDPVCGASPVLDDETYRLLQRAKISINMWDGTIPGVLSLWENLFPEYGLIIQDNQDMTMDLYVIGLVKPLEMELLAKGYIAPKPMGVLIRFVFVYEHEPMEHVFYIAGHHNSVTCNEMPIFEPIFNFGQDICMAGLAHKYSITELPPYESGCHFKLMPYAGGSFWGFSITETPPYTL